MANITIPNLPQAVSIDGTEQLLGVQSGTSKSITTGQIVSLANGSGGSLPFPVSIGGTGNTTFTTNGVIYGNTTSALGVTAAGTTGQVLIATTSGAPSWGAVPSTAAVTSITFSTTGLTPSTATTGAVTVAGTLATANGGTNLTSFTANGAVYATSTSALTTGTLPAISGGTGQSSFAIGDLLYSDTTTTLAKLADVATGSVLISGGVGVAPSYSASPTLTTSLATPLLIGGTGAASTLTLQSTSGAGTTDKILFKVGNNGAVTGGTIGTTGNWGFGGNATTFIGLAVPLVITGATSAYGQRINGNVQSNVTTLAAAYFSNIALENASFTTTDLVHFLANPPSGGAGSTATNQYGFKANSTLGSNGAATVTNSYGFYSDLASAANKFNFYANGTAANYFAGNVGIGTASPSGPLNVVAASASGLAIAINGRSSDNTGAMYLYANDGTTQQATITASATEFRHSSVPAAAVQTFYTNNIERMRISASGTVTLSTPLPVASGGTGATTSNAALTNLTEFTTTATAAGTTVLTNTSTYFQYFTGATTQTITLPVTSTLATGWSFHIVNNSTGNLTVNSSGANLVITVLPGMTVMCTCILTSGTTAASWEAGYTDFSTATGTGSVVLSASPAFTGVPTSTNYYNNATQTATNTATLTAAQITGPFLLGTPTATASYTLPLASAVETALGTPPNETGWEFVVFTTAAFAITLLTATGWTLVGSMATGATANSFAQFRCRKTGASAYSIYRIS